LKIPFQGRPTSHHLFVLDIFVASLFENAAHFFSTFKKMLYTQKENNVKILTIPLLWLP
jgi:hypothetical protein